MTEAEKAIESLYKDKYGQLVSVLLLKFNGITIDMAEDVVQETFAVATARWPQQGVPQNAGGWLYTACRNKTINLLKKTKRTVDLSASHLLVTEPEELFEDNFKDAQLRMLAACCHPDLAPKTQVILALKYVANLKVENIALQLVTNVDAIEKTLYRARQKIKDESLELSTHRDYSRDRLSTIHKVIYLIFNEGYKQNGTNLKQGKELCEEALILNKNLLESGIANSETKALQALMLFNAARFDTRFDANGRAIELEYQDRHRWNPELIRLGHSHLLESENSTFSPYHLEASIAFVHCSAQKFNDTNWTAICRYYEVLLAIYPSPFAEINYAVALQYNREDEKAYDILMNLYQNPYFHKLPLLETSLKKYRDRTKMS